MINPQHKSEFIIEPVLDLVIMFIKSSDKVVSNTIGTLFESNQLTLSSIMKNISLDINLYSKVSQLITLILKVGNIGSDSKVILFEEMLAMADECFKKRQLEHEKQTLLVLCSLSSHSMPYDVRRSSCKKLFHLTVAVKTMSQMSSRIQKLSLISIANLQCQAEGEPLKIKPNNFTYLSGLCAHKDSEIRNLAWCNFEYISKTKAGVHLLIENLQHLPGKFHSCCLTTMMDDTEETMIRVTAGDVLANIISFDVMEKAIVDQLFQNHQVFKAFEGAYLIYNNEIYRSIYLSGNRHGSMGIVW